MSIYKCKYCDDLRKNSNSLRNHERLCSKNPNKQRTPFQDLEFQKNIIREKQKTNRQNQYTKAKTLGLPPPQITEETRAKISSNVRINNLKRDDSVKKKISEGMKKAHRERRAWNIGMSRWNNEPSYPEKFFMKVIQNQFDDKNYVREFPLGIYSADFCWPHLKKVIEIDGQQHERYVEYKKRDERKDLYLKEQGYQILRISWKEFCSNTKQKINESYNFIHVNSEGCLSG